MLKREILFFCVLLIASAAEAATPCAPTLISVDQSGVPLTAQCPASQSTNSSVLYTDLGSAPIGALVTLYKADGTKEVVVFNGSNAPGVKTHAGRIIEVTPSTIKSAVANWQAGDVYYLRGGTYSGVIKSDNWNFASNFDLHGPTPATAAKPIAFVGYPGETATLTGAGGRPNFALEGTNPAPNYITIAGLNLVASAMCVGGNGAGNDGAEASGPVGLRVVGNKCTITDATSNTMTGMMVISGSNSVVLGNTFDDPTLRTIINNNHGIYVIIGADNIEIAYNRLLNLRMGHVIQIHTDGTPRDYQNISIHDNFLEGASPNDMRGITVSNVAGSSTVSIERNTLKNLGQSFSSVAVYAGNVTIKDNLFYGINAPNIALISGVNQPRKVVATGNRFETVSGSAISAGTGWGDITLSANRYCGQSPPSQESNPLPCSQ